MYKEIVEKYLTDNNETDLTKFTLIDNGNGVEIGQWDYGIDQPTPDHNLIRLEQKKENKKLEIKTQRNDNFAKPLLVRSSPDIYLKPQPDVNIFLAAYSMADGDTKEWFSCDENGIKQFASIDVTKDELIAVANHYEDRKTLEYNQCNKRCFAVDALTSIAEVENFDIEQVIV